MCSSDLLNDDVDIFRGIVADGNGVEAHGTSPVGVIFSGPRRSGRLPRGAAIAVLPGKQVRNDIDFILRLQQRGMPVPGIVRR